MLPLYNHGRVIPGKLPAGAHTGLWYDKFGAQWQKENDKWTFEKLSWIKTVTDGRVGRAELIAEMKKRLLQLAVSRGGKVCFFKTSGRFVTGLGREHPVENGFTWHFLLGAPFLPGSSVKGLVRAWVGNWQQDEGNVINRIFGPDGKKERVGRDFDPCDSKARNVGSVIFFDALPVEPVKLEADVMTPHYTKYYQRNEPPADWHSPNPIPFLTVAGEQSFVFALAPRRPENKDDQADVELAAGWLAEALAAIGAGAKTAVGYGRFIRDQRKEADWKQEQERARQQEEEKKHAAALAALSPVRREMEADGYSTDENKFMQLMTEKWLKQMESPDAAPETRQEIASLLAGWYQRNKPDMWEKPNKKNKEKIGRIKNVLQF
ncbi:type III-B CRISPR module RAMP protein Cmr6 [Desulfotomaculum copahuensis]|uniref:Type III-B CRISPR module RAMP protein Cmr6 n=1 Tax=Desulfotomaculum copahuensis TaxID=1838280 RepID=A0A1B7LCI3_9FIRM|nr:type III-B CRISPR module RAMP protein Cmr6 [Desulfotomaculum copahuensis]OAT80422.1 type III-B CRISPR module RAMP protein Cmr6 [Desulfotomaculum copahuensis]